jgi:PST family polysaccharide transporter
METSTTELRAYAGGRAIVLRYAAVALLSLAGASILIRELGTESWATYSVSYFVLISLDQALGARLLGSIVQSKDDPSRTDIESAVFLTQALGAGLIVVFGVLAWALAGESALPDLSLALICVGVSVSVYAVRAPAVALLERRLEYRWVALGEVCDQLAFYVLAVALALAGAGLEGVLVALAVRGVPTTVALRVRTSGPLVGRPESAAIRRLLAFSAPSLAIGAVLLLEGLTPAFILANSHPTVLAYVMTAGTLVGYASVVQYVTQRVGFPAFSRLSDAPAELARALTRSFEMTALAVVSMVAPVAALSPVWLPALFGSDWGDAAGITVAIGIAFSANACLYVVTSTLYALRRPRAVFALHAGGLVLFALLAVIGTDRDPLIGVAAAYAVSRYAVLGAAFFLVRREVGAFSPTRGFALLTSGAVASAATAYAVDEGSTLGIVVCGVVFFPAWLLLLWHNRAWIRRVLTSTKSLQDVEAPS